MCFTWRGEGAVKGDDDSLARGVVFEEITVKNV